MFIVPISSAIDTKSIDSIQSIKRTESATSDENNGSAFKAILNDVIQNVQTTEAATKMDAYNLSIGNMDDMHTMTINAAKAELALQTMIELRNKVIEAYSEVMRTNL